MSNPNAMIGRLEALFLECFHVEVPSPDTDLLETGVLDSLQFVELLVQLERRFGFRIKLEDLELDDLRTLARIARLVGANGGAAAPAAARSSSDAPA